MPLKPEQTQVVFWSVGRDVFAVLATVLCSVVLPTAFDYVNPGGLPSTVLALLIHIAAIKDLAGA